MLPANGYLDASSAITSTMAPTLTATSGQPQNSNPPTPDMENPYREKSPANTPTPAKVSAPFVTAVSARVSFPAAVTGSEVSRIPIAEPSPLIIGWSIRRAGEHLAHCNVATISATRVQMHQSLQRLAPCAAVAAGATLT